MKNEKQNFKTNFKLSASRYTNETGHMLRNEKSSRINVKSLISPKTKQSPKTSKP